MVSHDHEYIEAKRIYAGHRKAAMKYGGDFGMYVRKDEHKT